MPKNEFLCDCNMVHEEVVADTVSKMPSMYMMNCVADFFQNYGGLNTVQTAFCTFAE